MPVEVNQRQIAGALNLSPATVSKAFRNHPDITPVTRAKILEHAARLGYRVPVTHGSKGARAAKPFRMIGVLFHDAGPNTWDAPGTGYLTGLTESAELHNASLVVHRVAGPGLELLDEKQHFPALREGLLRGMILIHHFRPEIVAQLATQMPVVTISHHVPNVPVDHIDTDHIGAMASLVRHLIDLGHRRIGYVGRSVQTAYSQARFASFVQALVRHELPFNDTACLNVFSDVSTEACDAAIATHTRNGITAWLCANDAVAYSVITGLQQNGLRVPIDASVTGFDANAAQPPLPTLTTIRPPFVDMGSAALGRLIARLDHPSLPPQQTLLGCVTVPGESTGPVPSST